MTNHTEAPFSANFHLYQPGGLRIQFTVRGDGEPVENIRLVDEYVAQLTMSGYTLDIHDLEPGEEVEEVDAWVLGETSKGDACVYLYSANHGLKWRIATVYVERLDELPFVVGGASAWMGSAPERDVAASKGYLHTVEPFKVVMEPTGKTTDNGNPITRFARVLDGTPDASPAQHAGANANGAGGSPAHKGNGNGTDQPITDWDRTVSKSMQVLDSPQRVANARYAICGPWDETQVGRYLIALYKYESTLLERVDAGSSKAAAHEPAVEAARRAYVEAEAAKAGNGGA